MAAYKALVFKNSALAESSALDAFSVPGELQLGSAGIKFSDGTIQSTATRYTYISGWNPIGSYVGTAFFQFIAGESGTVDLIGYTTGSGGSGTGNVTWQLYDYTAGAEVASFSMSVQVTAGNFFYATPSSASLVAGHRYYFRAVSRDATVTAHPTGNMLIRVRTP